MDSSMTPTSLDVTDRYNKILGRITYDPNTETFSTTTQAAANILAGFEKPGVHGDALLLKISGWSNGYISVTPTES